MRPGVRSLGIFLAAALAGAVAGVGSYTFVYAKGYAYLTDDPTACANCHVMNPQYDGWLNSSHRNVATCNDCHTPEPLLEKYAVKALNGFNHAWAFTTDDFHEPIQPTPLNQRVAQQACSKCHDTLVHPLRLAASPSASEDAQLPSCTRCHGAAGHPF